MRFTLRSRLFFGIGVSLLLVFAVGLSSYLSLVNVESDHRWSVHTTQVLIKNNELLNAVLEAESNQRGYLLRKNERFLYQYLASSKKIDDKALELTQLVTDNPYQQAKIGELEKLLDSKKAVMSELINVGNGSISTSDELKISAEGAHLMEKISKVCDEIKQEENVLLQKRIRASGDSVNQTISILVGGIALIFLIVIILFINIIKAFNAQREARREIKRINISLEKSFEENQNKTWILTGISHLNEQLQGEQNLEEICENIVKATSEYAGAQLGALFLRNLHDETFIELCGHYGLSSKPSHLKKVKITDSDFQQVIKNKKPEIVKGDLIRNLELRTSFTVSTPVEVMLIPLFYDSQFKGVLELGFMDEISASVQEFIKAAAKVISVSLDTAEAHEIRKELFEKVQQQTEELESQQEELRVSNDELLNKTELLQTSEEELRVQQEELRQINDELREKAKLLEDNNQMIHSAKDTLTLKMRELEQTSKFKSEFLANMSHELRTPLNSILILARILRDNKTQNLTEDQQKYSNVIFKAGTDLLNLINDILDLSKIESGFLELHEEEVGISEISDDMHQIFDEVASGKGVNFLIDIDKNIPQSLYTDKQRLEQIIKNLLSNAFKFTPTGGTVKLAFAGAPEELKISVSDTGIGISAEKQQIIFEAFKQADGSTSREYGGTGLGLSISRELAKLMKANLTVESTEGKGSTFTLTMPLSKEQKALPETSTHTEKVVVAEEESVNERPLAEEQKRKTPLLLIVEDDEIFSGLLKDHALENGFEVKQVFGGKNVVEIAEEEKPDAIILDVMLPDVNGWNVLKNLKQNPETSLIPVHMMSAGDFTLQKAISEGATSFIKKPIDNKELANIFKNYKEQNRQQVSKILLIEDNEAQSEALTLLFKEKGIQVDAAFSGSESLEKLAQNAYQCIILDLHLPDTSGEELLEKIRKMENYQQIPIIINTAMDLDEEQMHHLLKHSNATVFKSVKSADRLMDEVNLFLHKIKHISKPVSNTPKNSDLKNKKVLLVDDDMRNIFALTAILEQHGLKIEIANDGQEALQKLEADIRPDLILMDIMMPKMDGYEAMEKIRAMPEFNKLPIIALTAKAMKEDRDKCINAGANDYITKPVDTDQLISLIKVWIS